MDITVQLLPGLETDVKQTVNHRIEEGLIEAGMEGEPSWECLVLNEGIRQGRGEAEDEV